MPDYDPMLLLVLLYVVSGDFFKEGSNQGFLTFHDTELAHTRPQSAGIDAEYPSGAVRAVDPPAGVQKGSNDVRSLDTLERRLYRVLRLRPFG